MQLRKTSRYICTLLLSSMLCNPVSAAEKKEKIPPAPAFCGVAVFADLVGPVMKAMDSRFSQMEVGARLNFRDHFFPLCELGIGASEREGVGNSNLFNTSAPYFRVGMDYNFNKKHNGNRFMGGLRYGFSAYDYDFEVQEFKDPVWNTTPNTFNLQDLNGRTHWMELSAGCETKLWKFIRLGWNLRFKARLKQKSSDYGKPYYVPGFGKNGSSCFGGTVNLIFDVSRPPKKDKK